MKIKVKNMLLAIALASVPLSAFSGSPTMGGNAARGIASVVNLSYGAYARADMHLRSAPAAGHEKSYVIASPGVDIVDIRIYDAVSRNYFYCYIPYTAGLGYSPMFWRAKESVNHLGNGSSIYANKSTSSNECTYFGIVKSSRSLN